MANKFFWIIILTFSYFFVFAQKQKNNWYFGNQAPGMAGVSFTNTVNPVPLINGATTYNHEGTASISDKQTGNLLFYTDGQTIWNKNHLPMQNGSGILGGRSSTQAALVVPNPGNNRQYYVFTTPSVASVNSPNLQIDGDKFRYSLLDMTLAGGLGAVISTKKNIILQDTCVEKLTAIKHSNGTDYWVIVHGWKNNNFYAYRVTKDSIITTPKITSIGSSHTPNFGRENSQGCMKASPNGKKIALVSGDRAIGVIELFDFDNCTGELSNFISIPKQENTHSLYGLSFSPDNTKLYISKVNTVSVPPIFSDSLIQYDIASDNAIAIQNSKNIIAVGLTGNPQGRIHGLQLGPDGKIYVAKTIGGSHLDVINNPNLSGVSCDYQFNGFYLGGRASGIGLPNFIEAEDLEVVKVTNISISADTVCQGEATTFQYLSPTAVSWRWNFGDGDSSTIQNPTHLYSEAGIYTVTVSVSDQCGNGDTVKNVLVLPSPSPSLYEEKYIQLGTSVDLVANPGLSSYTWFPTNNLSCTNCQITNTSTTNSQFYYVQLTNEYGCSIIDSVKVNVVRNETINIPNTFSPNGDNVNEVFSPYFSQQPLEYELTIFNRWGGVIFKTTNTGIGWDGTYHSVKAPIDTYVYVVKAKFLTENGISPLRLSSTVNLIR